MMHAKILEEIIKPFDVKIILSTSWVRHSEMVDKTIYPYSSGQHIADPFNYLSRLRGKTA